MKKAFAAVFLLLSGVSCSDRRYEEEITRLFARHGYEEHPPQRIRELLRSEGAAALRRLDAYAAVIAARKRFKRSAAEGPVASSGLLIGSRGGGFYVLRAFQQSPAWTAGLRDRDKILEVNGIRADAETLRREIQGRDEFRLKVKRVPEGRGEPVTIEGKQGVSLRALKESQVTLEFTVKKAEFPFPVIFGFYEPMNRTAFVRIGVFFEGAAKMVLSGLDALVSAGAEKAVFDLRDNKGGMPAEAAAILYAFAAQAGPVLELRSRHKGYSRRFEAPGKGKFCGLRTAALVNGETAVTAEAFASALKDLTGAAIVGKTTKGAVSVQRTFKLRGAKKFRLTVARLFPPSGRNLEGKGLAPDRGVELSEERAGELKKAWEMSSETVLLGDPFYLEASTLRP